MSRSRGARPAGTFLIRVDCFAGLGGAGSWRPLMEAGAHILRLCLGHIGRRFPESL